MNMYVIRDSAIAINILSVVIQYTVQAMRYKCIECDEGTHVSAAAAAALERPEWPLARSSPRASYPSAPYPATAAQNTLSTQ